MTRQRMTLAMPTRASALFKWLVLLIAVPLLASCGFQMQGVTPLPFDRLAVTIPENSQFGADVRRAIRAVSPNTVIVSSGDTLRGEKPNYQAQLQQVNVTYNTREVSLNAQGRVEEYELTLTFTFRLVNARNEVILPDTTLIAIRDLPYDDSVVQAKEGEMQTLFNTMFKSLVDRLVRRITAPDVAQAYDRLERAASEQAS